MLVNNICKVLSQLLAEVCDVKKLSKKENASNLNYFLCCSKDLAT